MLCIRISNHTNWVYDGDAATCRRRSVNGQFSGTRTHTYIVYIYACERLYNIIATGVVYARVEVTENKT